MTHARAAAGAEPDPAAGVSRRSFGAHVAGWACLNAALMAGCAPRDRAHARSLSFGDLPGWSDDDHQEALDVFTATLPRARPSPVGPFLADDWAALADRIARTRFASARALFEALFTPVLIGEERALLTAYYEPEIAGARHRGGVYQTPVYALPPEALRGGPLPDRAAIAAGALAGRGVELFWLADPVEAFFLEIQGSGRIRLPDGTATRVGYAGKNGKPYRAIGKVLVERGEMTLRETSAQSIKAWLRAHPTEAQDVMNQNPSYVFFLERSDLPVESGPIGAMNAPVTAWRSLAVDPAFHALGAPVWLDVDGEAAAPRLMIAQDVGGAIKGPQRGDIFVGSGADAGEVAGPYRRFGRMTTLLPNAVAARLSLV